MPLQLPQALADPGDSAAALLRRYYGPAFDEGGSFTGAAWDSWDSTGTRSADVDRFTADDLVAVSLLSVDVPARAAHALLVSQVAAFSALLLQVGPDRDLVEEADELTPSWPGWQLESAIRALPGLGRTTTSKLLARKRPRLFPIWDSVIGKVTDTDGQPFWEPLRRALRDQQLHQRLLALRTNAGVPSSVSALRVFDVVCWMEGKTTN